MKPGGGQRIGKKTETGQGGQKARETEEEPWGEEGGEGRAGGDGAAWRGPEKWDGEWKRRESGGQKSEVLFPRISIIIARLREGSLRENVCTALAKARAQTPANLGVHTRALAQR